MDIRAIKQENYDKIASDLNQTHYLHSFNWSKFREQANWKYEFIGFYQEGNLVAAANIRYKKLPKINKYFCYIPRGILVDYTDKELLKNVTKSLKKYLKKKNAFMFKVDPDIKRHDLDVNKNIIGEENNYELIKFLKKIGYKHQGYPDYNQGIQPRYTFRMYLDKSEEELYKSLQRETRDSIKAAYKRGIYLTQGHREDLDEFMDIMESTAKKLSKESEYLLRDKEFFNSLFDFYDEDKLDLTFAYINTQDYYDNIKNDFDQLKKEISLANEKLSDEDYQGKKRTKLENKTKDLMRKLESVKKELVESEKLKESNPGVINLGACMFIKEGNRIWYSYSGRNYDFPKFKAVELIIWETMKKYSLEGYEFLDLFGVGGDISKDSPLYGLYFFKRGFGGEYLEWIGEFDYVLNKPLYFIYSFLTKKDSHEQKGTRAVINKIITKKK